jgi:hypothetical protein
MSDDLRQKLMSEIDIADWEDLLPHFAHERLFACHEDLSLLEAAMAIAVDDLATIRSLIRTGHLFTPDDDLAAHWYDDKETFRFLIVQPFVLVKMRKKAEA